MRSLSVITEGIDITVMDVGCTLINICKEKSIRKYLAKTKQTPKILLISQEKLNLVLQSEKGYSHFKMQLAW